MNTELLFGVLTVFSTILSVAAFLVAARGGAFSRKISSRVIAVRHLILRRLTPVPKQLQHSIIAQPSTANFTKDDVVKAINNVMQKGLPPIHRRPQLAAQPAKEQKS